MFNIISHSVQFSSVAQLCSTLFNPMSHSTPGLPVHYQLPEFTQTHVYRVGDAIHPSHPLSSPSLPTFNLSQHLFQMSQFFTSGGQSIAVSASASVLPMIIQDWFPLGWTGWISLQSKGLSRVFSKRLLISWLQSPSAVILEPQKIKSETVFTVSHLFPMKWWNQMPWSSFSECWALSQLFHSPLSLSSRGFLVPLHFLP